MFFFIESFLFTEVTNLKYSSTDLIPTVRTSFALTRSAGQLLCLH